jgi:hypothetical protein
VNRRILAGPRFPRPREPPGPASPTAAACSAGILHVVKNILQATVRRLGRRILPAAIVLGALGVPSAALACGTGGYRYAGIASSERAYGVAAVVTPVVGGFDLIAGHVAGWVGVGGPGLGPGGSDEWLQAGVSRIHGVRGNHVYYELTLPYQPPAYHRLAVRAPKGLPVRVAVLELHGRPGWWRVWVNRRPVTAPIYLPDSHGRWAPQVSAESWDGGMPEVCNSFLFSFRRLSIAGAPGGDWRPFASGRSITSGTTRVVRTARSRDSFLAADLPMFGSLWP